MKDTVIFGSGQMGTMIARLLAGDHRIVCFADNSPKKQGSRHSDIPVLSPKEALEKKPDCVCLGVLDSERAVQMTGQLKELGYGGEILKPHELELFSARTASMRLLAEQIHREQIPGAVAELGVFRGEFAGQINAAFPDRKLHLYDTFEGFVKKDVETEVSCGLSRAREGDFSDTSQQLVYERMPYKDQVTLHPGYFPDTFHEETETFCFVSLDPDLYEPTKAGLEAFWPGLSEGGVIMVHDYNSTQFQGASRAVDEFLPGHRDAVIFPVCDLHGSLVIKKHSGSV